MTWKIRQKLRALLGGGRPACVPRHRAGDEDNLPFVWSTRTPTKPPSAAWASRRTRAPGGIAPGVPQRAGLSAGPGGSGRIPAQRHSAPLPGGATSPGGFRCHRLFNLLRAGLSQHPHHAGAGAHPGYQPPGAPMPTPWSLQAGRRFSSTPNRWPTCLTWSASARVRNCIPLLASCLGCSPQQGGRAGLLSTLAALPGFYVPGLYLGADRDPQGALTGYDSASGAPLPVVRACPAFKPAPSCCVPDPDRQHGIRRHVPG